MFTDAHAHIFSMYYKDIRKVISDAKAVDVCKIIIAATNLKECYEVISIAENYEGIFFCLGIHPDSILDDINALEKIIEKHKNNSKFIAIGEIGLDYHYGKDNKEKQLFYFDKQLSLAEKYELPVIIHSRDATLDTLEMLKQHNVKGVIHCFSGSIETAREYIKIGFFIGVGGVMTFKNSKLDNAIKDIPLTKILLETDSPYLTPEPFRKYSNEPKYIKTIAEYLANLKGISIKEVSEITEENIKELFDI